MAQLTVAGGLSSTLLAPEPARQYFDAVKTGPYDVFDWATRGQLEAIFQKHGFSLESPRTHACWPFCAM